MPQTPAQVRADLAAVLPLDLVGPSPDHPLSAEQLSQPPSRWYLTGFLVPYEASESQKVDPTSTEEIAGGTGDDATAPEQASARRAHFPSSLGISVRVPEEARSLTVTVFWGDYHVIEAKSAEVSSDEARASPVREIWQRTQRVEPIVVELKSGRLPRDVPGSGGLRLVTSVRTVPPASVELVPPGRG